MTTYGYLSVLLIILPVVAFMLGMMWNEVGHQLRKEKTE